METRLLLLTLCILFLPFASLAPQATAQQGNPTVVLPKGRIVAVPPNGSRWTMEISPAAKTAEEERSGKASGKRALPTHVERLAGRNAIQKHTITYSDGRTEIFYLVGDYVLQRYDNSNKIAAFQANSGDGSDMTSLRQKSFPGISWLSAKHFVDVRTVAGQQYYSFATTGSPQYQIPTDEKLLALIRVSDRYPFTVQLGGTTYTFSTIEPYPQDISLPPEYEEALANVRRQLGDKYPSQTTTNTTPQP
ncbi:MAG: hypothetical protein ACAI35_10545 [Candidatus Methylacidiphilales bacterium]|nr:hypothetical protein [Candidatus Methylacidiphilales bacterium]